MISFRNFALRRGERLLLSKVDIALHAGWRVGVVGRNGCGKTSLFAAILGEIEADSGDLEKSPKLRIASVAQETPSLPDAAIDFVVSGDIEVHAVLMAEEAAIAAEDWDAVAEAHQRLAEDKARQRELDSTFQRLRSLSDSIARAKDQARAPKNER